MTKPNLYSAPWGKPLTVVTGLVVALCMGLSAFVTLRGVDTVRHGGGGPVWVLFASAVLPWLILLLCLYTLVRGYRLEKETLWVLRLGRLTRISLTDLVSASWDPKACSGSIRIWGTGGVFSFTGTFSNGSLGTYEAYATDFSRTVVLRFPGRTVVVTPDRPKEFVRDLLEQR